MTTPNETVEAHSLYTQKYIFSTQTSFVPAALFSMLASGFATSSIMVYFMRVTGHKAWIAASTQFGNLQRCAILSATGGYFSQVRQIGDPYAEAAAYTKEANEKCAMAAEDPEQADTLIAEANTLKALAAKKIQIATARFHAPHIVSIAYGGLMMLLLSLTVKPLLSALNFKDELIHNNVDFFKSYVVCIIPMFEITNFIQALYSITNNLTVNIISIARIITELLCVYVLTFGIQVSHLQIPSLGMYGYGLGQSIQNLGAYIACLTYLHKQAKNQTALQIDFRHTKQNLLNFSELKNFLRIGIPSSLQVLADTIGGLITSSLAGSLPNGELILGLLNPNILWSTLLILQIPLAFARAMEQMLSSKVGEIRELYAIHGSQHPEIQKALHDFKQIALWGSIHFIAILSLLTSPLLLFPIAFTNTVTHVDADNVGLAKMMMITGAIAHMMIAFIIQGAAGLRGGFGITKQPMALCFFGSVFVNGGLSYLLMHFKPGNINSATGIMIGLMSGYCVSGLSTFGLFAKKVYTATVEDIVGKKGIGRDGDVEAKLLLDDDYYNDTGHTPSS